MKHRALLLLSVTLLVASGCYSRARLQEDRPISLADRETECRLGGGGWQVVGRDRNGEEDWDCVDPSNPNAGRRTSQSDAIDPRANADETSEYLRDEGKARSNAMFFPGGGHFYSGERTRGTMLLAGSAGALLAGALLSAGSKPCDNSGPGDDCTYDENTHSMVGSKANRTPLIAGAAAAVGLWAYGIIDAPDSARRMNARNGLQVGSIDVLPEPVLTVARRGEPVVGVQFRLTW